MSNDDVINKAAAMKFAWRAVNADDLDALLDVKPEDEPMSKSVASQGMALEQSPDETAERSGQGPAENEKQSDTLRRQWEANKEECRVLSNEVLYIWSLRKPEEQAPHIPKLARTVRKMMFELAWMRHFPLAAVRLWLLVIQHRNLLTKDDRNNTFHTLRFMVLPAQHKELLNLFLSVAELGLGLPAYLLEENISDAFVRRYPEFGQRVIQVYEQADSLRVKEVAIAFVAKLPLHQSSATLIQALRSDIGRVRWTALTALLEKDPTCIPHETLMWLLEDAVVHPFPRKHGTNAYRLIKGYCATLLRAVKDHPPPDGYQPLLRMIHGRGESFIRDRAGMTEEWALCVLAAAYPERAIAPIDSMLRHPNSWKRYHAIDALWHLREDLAKPRLLIGAGDLIGHIAERAQRFYFSRFHQECLPSPLSGMEDDLLIEAPSDVFLGRVAVLRSAADKARHAIMDTLLAEAAQLSAPAELGARERENLVLLLACLRDDSTGYRRKSEPKTRRSWANVLVKHFGEPAFAKLLSMAEFHAGGGPECSWLTPLSELAQEGILSEAQIAALRACIYRFLLSPNYSLTSDEIDALRPIGATVEVLDMLWNVALERLKRDTSPRGFPHISASRVLVEMKDCPELDERIAVEGREAFERKNWEEFERIIYIGCQRKVQAAADLALACADAVEKRPGLLPVAKKVASSLCFMGGAPADWLHSRLLSPESPCFCVAADLVRRPAPEGMEELLWKALSSPARKGAAAAEAAEALVSLELLPVDDARLPPILEAAPIPSKAALLYTILIWDGPLSSVWKPLISVLTSDDIEAAWNIFERLRYGEYGERDELFHEVWEQGPNEFIKGDIAQYLGEPHSEEGEEGSSYWRDHWADTDEDEEEEGEDGDEDEEGDSDEE